MRSCRQSGTELILGCDANAHHHTWGSTDTNPRGESLFQFIMANNLDIVNKGNNPTFVTRQRSEVIDLTICTSYINNSIKNWYVSMEESSSDHRYICFQITGVDREITTYRNPKRTDWGNFKIELDRELVRVGVKISDTNKLNEYVEELTDTIIKCYENNSPEIKRVVSRRTVWWSKDLEKMRRTLRKEFNKAKYSGRWETYRTSLTEYNKQLRQAKRDSWRKYCEELESVPDCARLQKVLAKEQGYTIDSLRNGDDEYTTTGKETLTELYRVHFPGCAVKDNITGSQDSTERRIL